MAVSAILGGPTTGCTSIEHTETGSLAYSHPLPIFVWRKARALQPPYDAPLTNQSLIVVASLGMCAEKLWEAPSTSRSRWPEACQSERPTPNITGDTYI